MIAVNVMKAVKDHAAYVRQACESGADAIVMGAGLPLDLPEMAEATTKMSPFSLFCPNHAVSTSF